MNELRKKETDFKELEYVSKSFCNLLQIEVQHNNDEDDSSPVHALGRHYDALKHAFSKQSKDSLNLKQVRAARDGGASASASSSATTFADAVAGAGAAGLRDLLENHCSAEYRARIARMMGVPPLSVNKKKERR